MPRLSIFYSIRLDKLRKHKITYRFPTSRVCVIKAYFLKMTRFSTIVDFSVTRLSDFFQFLGN